MPEHDLVDRLTALSLALTDSEWPNASRTCIEAAEALGRARRAIELALLFNGPFPVNGRKRMWREIAGPESEETAAEVCRFARETLNKIK